MEIKEGIIRLKRLFSNYELDLPNTDSLEILDMAIQALEKQIPKKPADQHGVWLNKRCPSCDYVISRSEEGIFNYCKKCGQALDWN